VSQYLLTFLPSVGDDYLRWAVCDDKGEVIGQADHGTFAEAASAAERRRVVMVVAGTEVLMEEAQVPSTNLARALKAVPYSLEEQLAQDVESSHFAFGSRLSNGNIPVVVMARDGLEWIQELAASVKLNLQEIVPETLALPFSEGFWTVMTNNGHASVRLSPSRGFSCDSEMLSLLLSNSMEGAPPERVEEEIARSQHFCCGPDEFQLHPQIKPDFVRTEVALYARGLSQYKKPGDRINLLQGEYSKTEAMGKAWKPWRLPAALAATLLALWGGTSFLHYQSLGGEETRLQNEMVSTLKAAYPDVRRPENDPKRQMASRLNAGNGTGVDNGSFVMMMSAVGTSLKQLSEPSVTSINYKSGQLDIVLEAASLQDVDKLKSSLESEQVFVANVQSAIKERERIKARLRVESKS